MAKTCKQCGGDGFIEVGNGNSDTSYKVRCEACNDPLDLFYPEREKGDDDGQEYGDPRDAMEERASWWDNDDF